MRLDDELYAEADRYIATGKGQEDIAQLLNRAATRIRALEEALRRISLESQSSMGDRHHMGAVARNALEVRE